MSHHAEAGPSGFQIRSSLESTSNDQSRGEDHHPGAEPQSARVEQFRCPDSSWVNTTPKSHSNADLDESGQSGRGPRVRIAKACMPCRKVKLKCYGGHPCARCSALKFPLDTCVFPPSQRGKTRRTKAEIEAERSMSGVEGTPPQTSRIQGREHHQWDEGRTMRNMKEDFAKWKHDEDLTVNGPRNENLWRGHANAGPSDSRGPPYPPHPAGTSSALNRHFPLESSARTVEDDDLVPDKYTTLPFPGDAHNPLGVLAEASASAGRSGSNGLPSPSPFQPTGGPGSKPVSNDGDEGESTTRGYYIPLERVLKRDAPHIMSLISITE
jgi:hypothetical protein